jgi:hypothetical protein
VTIPARLAGLSRAQLRAALEDATRDLPPHERVAVAERVAREVAHRQRRMRYPSPGALAHRLDPLVTVETPALRLLDTELVQAATRLEAGEAVRLGVFMPPQEGKSRRVTMAGVLWLLLRNPNWRVGIASFESEIAAEFSSPIRNWIAEHGSGTPLNPRSLDDDLLGITLRWDSTSKSRFGLAGHAGGVYAVGMKGGLTGRPLDVLVIDDPYKNREAADSPKHRKAVVDWYQNVALTRLPSASLLIVVQTRWHPDDLAGYIVGNELNLPEEARTWRYVNVPAQAERRREDDRTWLPDSLNRDPGTYLVSARGRTPEQWAAQRAAVGEMVWGSLYQQHPTPPTGAVFAYEHISRSRRPADWETTRSRTAVAVDTSAGGDDEAGLIGGYRGTDGRAYITTDRSGAMSAAQWARRAWLMVLDLAADDLVWEANLAGPLMRSQLQDAWARIVRQWRTLLTLLRPDEDADPFTGRAPEPLDLDRPEVRDDALRHAARIWAAAEQRLSILEVEVSPDDLRELGEVYDRITSGLLSGGVLETPPARLVAVHASVGKRARATPIAVAVETGKVSHIGVLAELEQELTQWQEGAASPGRMDAYVWLVTHLLAVRRARTTTSAATTLPGVGDRR